MGAPFYDLVGKLEAAAAGLLRPLAVAPEQVFTGQPDGAFARPCVICYAESIPAERIKDTGIYDVILQFIIQSSVDEENSPAPHKARVAKFLDRVRSDDIVSALSGPTDDLYIYDVIFQDSVPTVDPEKRFLKQTTTFLVTCQPSELGS